MGNDFTKEELRHIMIIMNGYGDHECEICGSIRKKLQDQIAEMPDEFFNSEAP